MRINLAVEKCYLINEHHTEACLPFTSICTVRTSSRWLASASPDAYYFCDGAIGLLLLGLSNDLCRITHFFLDEARPEHTNKHMLKSLSTSLCCRVSRLCVYGSIGEYMHEIGLLRYL